MRTISFNPAMLAAVLAGRKTETRRRLAAALPVQQEPDRYRAVAMSPAGVVFEDLSAARPTLLPPVPCPLGQVGELLQLQEAPARRLRLTGLRVEQVRSLRPADALAEGICQGIGPAGQAVWGGVEPHPGLPGTYRWYNSPVAAFHGLLDSIYPTAWARNEWVWVLEFRLEQAAG